MAICDGLETAVFHRHTSGSEETEIDITVSMQTRALILGPGGIGSAIIHHLIAADWHCTVVGRKAEALQAWADRYPDLATRVAPVGDWEAMEALQQELADEPPFDAVVNAVGSILLKPAHRTTATDWQTTLAQNLTSAFCALRLAVARVERGSLLLFSSAAAQLGLGHHEAIAAAKAGIEGLTRSAAATYAGRGLRVNALALGLVDTPLAAGLLANAAARKTSEKMHPLGRIGEADQVARIACQLIDPANDWITGAIWSVDGGLAHVRRP